jgi:hemoglobin-like flavoprotein
MGILLTNYFSIIMLPISIPDRDTLDTDLIQSSYSIIKIQADEFTESFYQILFEKYPDIRPLFLSTDMNKQKEKLIESLDLVLVNVHNPKAFNSILKDLGKRHVKYGAVLTDYPLVGDALLQALEKHLGKDWTPNVKQAWSLAYKTIADTMAEGAKSDLKNDSKPGDDFKKNSSNRYPDKQADRYNKIAFNKLFLIVCIGIAGISGCAIWTLIKPDSSITPKPVGESRTN